MSTLVLIYVVGIVIGLFIFSGIDKDKNISFIGLLLSSLVWPAWIVYGFYIYMRDYYKEDRL